MRDAGDYFTATYTPVVAEFVSVGQSARRFTLTRWHRLMPFVAMIVGGRPVVRLFLPVW